MALALSTDRLKSDNLLIKNLKSLEQSGLLTDIVTGKTSTLTQGTLSVKYIYAGDFPRDAKTPLVNP